MRIKSHALPPELVEWIRSPDPLESEDVLIEDEEGTVLGVIIQPNAYAFFLKKVEEREDAIDYACIANREPYSADSKSLEQFCNPL